MQMDSDELDNVFKLTGAIQRQEQLSGQKRIQELLELEQAREESKANAPKCPACASPLLGRVSVCAACQRDIIWFDDLPVEFGTEPLVFAELKSQFKAIKSQILPLRDELHSLAQEFPPEKRGMYLALKDQRIMLKNAAMFAAVTSGLALIVLLIHHSKLPVSDQIGKLAIWTYLPFLIPVLALGVLGVWLSHHFAPQFLIIESLAKLGDAVKELDDKQLQIKARIQSAKRYLEGN
jgi:hypothetical protein